MAISRASVIVSFQGRDLEDFLSALYLWERQEIFSPFANQLVLVEHWAITSCHGMNSRSRFLSLGIIAPVNGCLSSPGIPTSRHVSSRDNVDVFFNDGNIPALLPKETYSSQLFIGNWVVERWFETQERLPFLRSDLLSRLMYVDTDAKQVPLFV